MLMEQYMKSRRGRRMMWGTVALLLVGLLVAGATFLPVHGEEEIYDAVVRLHVIAASDSEQDQSIKLQVRDAVLTQATAILEGCEDRAEAERRLIDASDDLLAVARTTLDAIGCEDEVRIEMGREEYPTRNYEAFCFPAGEYVSLRVIIGEGEGQNFWCVVFPPLCMRAATVSRNEAEEEFIAVGLDRDQYSIITQTENTKYKLRFKFLEVLQGYFR